MVTDQIRLYIHCRSAKIRLIRFIGVLTGRDLWLFDARSRILRLDDDQFHAANSRTTASTRRRSQCMEALRTDGRSYDATDDRRGDPEPDVRRQHRDWNSCPRAEIEFTRMTSRTLRPPSLSRTSSRAATQASGYPASHPTRPTAGRSTHRSEVRPRSAAI